MSYKPKEADWMAFLYGEMLPEERERMENYLQQNPSAQKQLDEYKALQNMLQVVEDKEVIAPPIVVGDSRQRFLWDVPYIKTVMSIAASLLLLMVVGRVTNTTIATDEAGLHISFGAPTPTKTVEVTQASLTQEQVQQLIDASLKQNNVQWESSLEENKKAMTVAMRNNVASHKRNSEQLDMLVQQVASASKEQVQSYVASLQTQNMKMMQEYMQLTSNEQKDYMEDLLVDFAKYLQQQRNDDLKLLQTKITDVEQNNNLFKAETEQILTSIIGNTGGSINTGIRN